MMEICEYFQKTCFAKCNGRNHEGCYLKDIQKEAYKGQELFQSDKLDIKV